MDRYTKTVLTVIAGCLLVRAPLICHMAKIGIADHLASD